MSLLLTATLASIVLLLVLILKFRVHAFISLLIASIAVGIFTGMDLPAITDSIKTGMGNALGFIATVIGLGAILGKILEASGGTEAIAQTLLRAFGQKRAPWALMLTGFIISIPVFLDVGLVLLAPILYALSRDTGKPLLYFAYPLLAGMVVTHACVPPTPGPIAVAGYLKADLGLLILFGVIIGVPTAIIGTLFGKWVAGKVGSEIPVHLASDIAAASQAQEEKLGLPSFGMIMTIIGLPLVLMLCGSVAKYQADKEAAAPQVETAQVQSATAADDEAIESPRRFKWTTRDAVQFLGHPFIALLIATLSAWVVLGLMRGWKPSQLMEMSSNALGPAGLIILVTGAGGVFKQILGDSGAAQALAQKLVEWQLAPLVMAYLLAALIRVIQGSATVAMITAGGLVAGILAAMPTPPAGSHLALIALAIAFGSTVASHVNDSGFWIVNRYLGMSEKDTLKSFTTMTTIISLTGFALVLIAGFLLKFF